MSDNLKIGLIIAGVVVVLGGLLVLALVLTGGDDGEEASDQDESDQSDEDDETDEDESDQSDEDDESDEDESEEDEPDQPESDVAGPVAGDTCDALAGESGTAIETGDVGTGTITSDSGIVVFEYAGDAASVDIAVDQTDDTFDPVLVVCTPNGLELERDDDGGGFPNSLLEGVPLAPGDLIVISGYSGSTGSFEVTISG